IKTASKLKSLFSFRGTQLEEVSKKNELFYAVLNNKDFLYCFIPKVACSSVKEFILENSDKTVGVEDFKTDGDFHLYMKNEFGLSHLLKRHEATMEEVMSSNTYKFFLVRHPFERLVSCFEDKSRRNTKNDQYFY